MSHTVLRAPKTLAEFTPAPGDKPISSITLGLGQKAGSAVAWRLAIVAILSGGRVKLGQIITAPVSTRSAARVVAIASCPGAIAWQVVARPVRPYTAAAAQGTLKLDGCEYTAGMGVIPLDGSLLTAGGPDAGAYNHDSALGVGTATIPPGSRVEEYSIIANSVGNAEIRVTTPVFGALPLITIPPSSAWGTKPKNLIGPATIDFIGNVFSWQAQWSEVD